MQDESFFPCKDKQLCGRVLPLSYICPGGDDIQVDYLLTLGDLLLSTCRYSVPSPCRSCSAIPVFSPSVRAVPL